jgi:hypothetical protein
MSDIKDFNRALIAEFRATGGVWSQMSMPAITDKDTARPTKDKSVGWCVYLW